MKLVHFPTGDTVSGSVLATVLSIAWDASALLYLWFAVEIPRSRRQEQA